MACRARGTASTSLAPLPLFHLVPRLDQRCRPPVLRRRNPAELGAAVTALLAAEVGAGDRPVLVARRPAVGEPLQHGTGIVDASPAASPAGYAKVRAHLEQIADALGVEPAHRGRVAEQTRNVRACGVGDWAAARGYRCCRGRGRSGRRPEQRRTFSGVASVYQSRIELTLACPQHFANIGQHS